MWFKQLLFGLHTLDHLCQVILEHNPFRKTTCAVVAGKDQDTLIEQSLTRLLFYY